MQTVGSLIQDYLDEKGMVPNQLAEKSGVSRQRLGEIIGKNRCPAKHNFQSLLSAMDPDSALRQLLNDAYQMQRARNKDRKIKTGSHLRQEALLKRILEQYEVRVIPSFDHMPCTKDVECDLDSGLHSITSCMDETMQRHVRHYQQMKEEMQEYYDEVEKKSGMEMETFASSYRTRVGLWITLVPKDRKDKMRLNWNVKSIFDGLVINRSDISFVKLLWDLPLKWNDERHSFHRKRKGHAVSIRSSIGFVEGESVREDAAYFDTLRNIGIQHGKKRRRLQPSELYRAISRNLSMQALDLSSQKRQDTLSVRRGDVYELCDCLHQMLVNQKAQKKNHDGLTFQLHSLLSRFRIVPVAAQFEAVMLHWAAQYFEDLANITK